MLLGGWCWVGRVGGRGVFVLGVGFWVWMRRLRGFIIVGLWFWRVLASIVMVFMLLV